MTTVEPAPDGLGFVGESVSCDMWIVHDILRQDNRSTVMVRNQGTKCSCVPCIFHKRTKGIQHIEFNIR